MVFPITDNKTNPALLVAARTEVALLAGVREQVVARALRLLLGLPNFKPREAESLWFALASFDRGMDFADALHLALSAVTCPGIFGPVVT